MCWTGKMPRLQYQSWAPVDHTAVLELTAVMVLKETQPLFSIETSALTTVQDNLKSGCFICNVHVSLTRHVYFYPCTIIH